MTPDDTRCVHDLLTGGTTLMVATRDSSGALRSRPLTVGRVDGDDVHMLVDSSADWARACTPGDEVHATLSDNRDNTWASFTGTVTITKNRQLIDDLWNPFAGAFFENGKDDPNVAVLTMSLDHGEFWSTTPGRVGSLITLLKAKFGDSEDVGERGTVDFDAPAD